MDGEGRRHRQNVPGARALRQHLTASERRLWERLRARRLEGWKFRRQHPVGAYVVDFYCAEARLAVELDGAPHADPIRQEADAVRQEVLEERGIAVLRIASRRVFTELERVLEEIAAACRNRRPPPPPSTE